MAKHANNVIKKSDRHREHQLKYAMSHSATTLERWYEKITTPQPEKKIYRTIKEVKPSRRVGRDPAKVELRRIRDLNRAIAYNETKQMAANDVNIE